jgi:hypothetical protein
LYQAKSWDRARRVVAKVEWHDGELFPRVGFIVTNLSRPAKRVVRFYNQRGTAAQWIKQGKNAVKWTRLSCHDFVDNQVRLATVRAGLQLGQLSAAVGAAPGGASPDVDDVVGETDQNRGEGRAPFPADNLPDGGSGGPARVVPGHSGRDWAAEIGNRDVRMKADRVKTKETTEEVSSHPGEKGNWSQKWHRNIPSASERPRLDWEKG